MVVSDVYANQVLKYATRLDVDGHQRHCLAKAINQG
jgi:hypothetical protein